MHMLRDSGPSIAFFDVGRSVSAVMFRRKRKITAEQHLVRKRTGNCHCSRRNTPQTMIMTSIVQLVRSTESVIKLSYKDLSILYREKTSHPKSAFPFTGAFGSGQCLANTTSGSGVGPGQHNLDSYTTGRGNLGTLTLHRHQHIHGLWWSSSRTN